MGFFKKKYILTSAAFFAVSSVLCAKNFSFNLNDTRLLLSIF